ncbi:MAG: patatin-like phospholipase family protein [Hyphomicrobiaceae bacterium]|nr:patatin-like phospholipase family protein [Hyphomicrobiaceae bacterium]
MAARRGFDHEGSVRFFNRALRLNLALQGGGAHGAFTWGVLDRLLEEETLEIGWVSGTSAGAVNAVALAGGLAEGGRQGAREKLREVWQAVYQAGVPDLLRLNPFLYSLTRASFSQMAGLMSPYEFNPMGFDPLRRLLERTIDFERIKRTRPVGLLIAATEVATGRPRYFRANELTVESVLASACLPTLHHAVEIEGKAYWDGGFSANPDLVTLASESPLRDTLLVMINPVARNELPTGSREISGHINHITFNAPLRRDVELIEMLRRETGRGWLGRHTVSGRLQRHRFHMVEAGRYTATLKHETKMKPDWGLFTYLHGAGRTEMHKWLDRHGSAVGRHETVNLGARILGHGDAAASGAPAAGAGGMVAIEPGRAIARRA